MLRVLHIGAKNFPPAHGGTERVVYNIVTSIDEIDFYILVEWEQIENERIKILPKNLNYFKKILFIFKYVKENKIDILHFHNEKYIPMAIMFSVYLYNVILTVHGVHFRSPKFSLINRLLFWIVDIMGYLFLPKMIFCSEYDQKEFSKFLFFRKSYFINNGTEMCDCEQNDIDIIYNDTYIYLGRITPAKNIHNLIDSANANKLKVHIYGNLDNECQAYCNEALKKIKESQYVEYMGVVKHEDVFKTIKKYKAFIYITIMEGLPLSVLEAASCGVHLILSDIPQHRYLNLPSVTYVGINKSILPQINDIPNGLKNREHIAKNFSIEKMGRQYLNIYNSLKKND